MLDFRRKVVLVTGASSGIGAAIARGFGGCGAHVVVHYHRNRDGAEKVASAIDEAGGSASVATADLSRPAAAGDLVDAVVAEHGRLDVLVNNAGDMLLRVAVAEMSDEDYGRVMDVNLTSAFAASRQVIPVMQRQGGGAIVNIASILGQVAFANAPAYTAAKHGVVGLTRAAALEYSAKGLRINAVGPAFIHTPMIAPIEGDPTACQAVTAMHPIGRLGEPAEVAELVVWLSSDRASFVTGAYYAVDGGYLAH